MTLVKPDFAMAPPAVLATAGYGASEGNTFSSIEFFYRDEFSLNLQSDAVTKKTSRLFLSQVRPPNPQFPMPPGAVCRGAIVDQAIQGLLDQPVNALAVAGQRPVG